MKTKRVFDGQRGVITSIFVASIFVNLLVLTAPLYMLQLFARVMASGSMPTLIALTTGAAIALVFFFLFDVIRQRLVARLGSRLEARLSPVVLQGMISGNLPAPLRTAEPIRDIQDLRGFVTSPVFIALLDAPWSLLFIALIFVFSPILGLVSVAGLLILLGLGVLSELMGRGPGKTSEEAARETNAAVDEMMVNAEIIHAMGKTSAQIGRWRGRAFTAILFGTLVTDRVALMTSLAKAVRMGLQIAVLGVGVVLVINNQLTPGLMIASSILLGRAAAPVEQSISRLARPAEGAQRQGAAEPASGPCRGHQRPDGTARPHRAAVGGKCHRGATGAAGSAAAGCHPVAATGPCAGADRPIGGRQDHAGPRAGGAATAGAGACAHR
ncbi:ABC transporter transmembrane domain-containing protein (plasmid) [Phaeobacter sp. BS34]|uniref:ABC transporter transmembrane domain-containing protein n=1 Tax=Phaeobacter sp. BS34 TaxID=2907240 RepID=UPI003703F9F1